MPPPNFFKGEAAGHEFRGNRYTGGIPGEMSSAERVHAIRDYIANAATTKEQFNYIAEGMRSTLGKTPVVEEAIRQAHDIFEVRQRSNAQARAAFSSGATEDKHDEYRDRNAEFHGGVTPKIEEQISKKLMQFRANGGTIENISNSVKAGDAVDEFRSQVVARADEEGEETGLGDDSDYHRGTNFTQYAIGAAQRPGESVLIARDVNGDIVGALSYEDRVDRVHVGHLGSTNMIPGTGTALTAALASRAANNDAQWVESELIDSARTFHEGIGRQTNAYGESKWDVADTLKIGAIYDKTMKTRAKMIDSLIDLAKGDVAGHAFHGNRFTGGIGGNPTPAGRLGITSKSPPSAAEIDGKLKGGIGPTEANYIHAGIRVFAEDGGKIKVGILEGQRKRFSDEVDANLAEAEAQVRSGQLTFAQFHKQELGLYETKQALQSDPRTIAVALDKDGKLAGAVSFDPFSRQGMRQEGRAQIHAVAIGDLGSTHLIRGVGSALIAAVAAQVKIGIGQYGSRSSLDSFQIAAAYKFHSSIGRWLDRSAGPQRSGVSRWNATDLRKVQGLWHDAGGPELLLKASSTLLAVKKLQKGDVAGHEFHGNRYTGGIGLKEPTESQRARVATRASAFQKEHLDRIERNLRRFRDAGGTVELIKPSAQPRSSDDVEADNNRMVGLVKELQQTLADTNAHTNIRPGGYERAAEDTGVSFTNTALEYVGSPGLNNYHVFVARDAEGHIAGAINATGGRDGVGITIGYLGTTHIIPGTGTALTAAVAAFANSFLETGKTNPTQNSDGGGGVQSEYTGTSKRFHEAIGRTLNAEFSSSSSWSNVTTYLIAKTYHDVMGSGSGQTSFEFKIDKILASALYALERPTYAMFKGEAAGHEFRGNRFTGGIPGGADTSHALDSRFPAHWQDARGQSQINELLEMSKRSHDDLWEDEKAHVTALIRDLGIRDGRMMQMPDNMVHEFIEHPPKTYIPTRNSAVDATLKTLETQEFADRTTEMGHIIDPQTGRLIGSVTSNEPQRITFGPDDMTKLQGAVFTHNHPAGYGGRTLGGTLSGLDTMSPEGDLRCAQAYGLSEIRAVDDKYIYTLRPPVGQATFRSSDSMRLNDTREDHWADMENKMDQFNYENRVRERMIDARAAGDGPKEAYIRTQVQDHAGELLHEAWISFAKETGYQYTRTERVVAKSYFFKGEAAGHEFRGNRFTGGIPGGAHEFSEERIKVATNEGRRILRDLRQDNNRYTSKDLRDAAKVWRESNIANRDKVAKDLELIAKKIEAKSQPQPLPQHLETDPYKITEAELLRRIMGGQQLTGTDEKNFPTIERSPGDAMGNVGGVTQETAEYIAAGAKMFQDAGGKLVVGNDVDQATLTAWRTQVMDAQSAKGYSSGRTYVANGVDMQRSFATDPPSVLFGIDKDGKVAGSITWRRSSQGGYGPEIHIGVLGSMGSVKGVGSALTLAVARYAGLQGRVVGSSYISNARTFHAAIGRRLDFQSRGNSGWSAGDIKNLGKVWSAIDGDTLLKNPSNALFQSQQPVTPDFTGVRIGAPIPAGGSSIATVGPARPAFPADRYA